MNAGRVELDLVAVGKDQVSAMLKTLERNVKTSAAEMQKAGTAAAGFGTQVDQLKAGVAPVNKIREGFENLRSNAMFVVGAVAGVVGVVGALSTALNSNAVYIKQWEDVAAKVPDLLDKSAEAGRRLRLELGLIAEQSKVVDLLDDLSDSFLAVQDKAGLAEAGIAAYNGELEKLGVLDGILAGLPTILGGVEEMERKRNLALTRSAELTERLVQITADYSLGLERAKQAASTPYGPPLPEGWDPEADINFEPMVITPRKGGVGGRRDVPRVRVDEAFYEEQARKIVEGLGRISSPDGFTTAGDVAGGGSAIGRTAGAAGGLSETNDLLAQQRDRFNELADAVGRFSGALGPVLDEMLPGLGTTIGGIESITRAYTEATDDSAKSQVKAWGTGAAAALGGIGKIMGGKRGLFIGEGLGEEAAAIASAAVGDLAGFALHQSSAVGYFAAAAAMGGGGGKGGGGARGGGARGGGSGDGQGGGNTTVINHFSTLVTDPHMVTRATASASRSTLGTGQRRGG